MDKPDPYLIEAAAKALDVLEVFTLRDEVRLTDVMRELGLIKSTAFRLLYTLEKKGYIERAPGGRAYRRRRRHRIGLASISGTIPFVSEVERGIEAEARRAGLEVIVRHHEFDPLKMVTGTEELIAAGAELIVCYNPDEHVSHVVADRCAQAGVPIVAITFPVPGARVFGINNYRAGLVGGEGLGEHVAQRWEASLDCVVLLDIPGNSPAQQARITGMLEGLRKQAPVADKAVLHLHTDRMRTTAEELMRDVLKKHPRARHIAVLSYNDVNALGALTAVEQAGRSGDVLILSQGGVAEVRRQIRRARGPLWGAVAHFPERFGERLMPLILRILRGDTVPSTTYTEHVLLTRSNLSKYYRD